MLSTNLFECDELSCFFAGMFLGGLVALTALTIGWDIRAKWDSVSAPAPDPLDDPEAVPTHRRPSEWEGTFDSPTVARATVSDRTRTAIQE